MRKVIIAFLISFFSLNAHAFKIESQDFKNGQVLKNDFVYNDFGCTGKNISPHLKWSNPPKDTKSFAVMAYDPDAPTGSGWWHWTVFNIPASVMELKSGVGSQGTLPDGAVHGNTDFGKPGYGGPCPPANGKKHHYQFTVYALKVEKLNLDDSAPGAKLGYFVRSNSLGYAKITGIYSRSNSK